MVEISDRPEKRKLLYSIQGLYRDNGREHGNYSIVCWFFRDIEKEHGNYNIMYWGYIGVMERKWKLF